MKNYLSDKRAQARSFGFAGFYNSIFLDSDMDLDLMANDNTIQTVLSKTDLWDSFDTGDYMQDVAESWIRAYLSADFRFVKCFVRSPQFYNYETDTIIYQVDMPFTVQELIDKVKGHPYFDAFLKKEFTLCDGYIPFYDNNVKDFLYRIYANGYADEVEMGVLISVYCAIKGYQDGDTLEDTLNMIIECAEDTALSVCKESYITDDYQKNFLEQLDKLHTGCKVDEVNGKLGGIWDLCENWYYDSLHNAIRRVDDKTGKLF